MNDAFIIDNQTKEELIAKDPKSAEIIKPLVRGRDIQRYNVNWKGLWLIATFPARSLSIDEYPAVRRHLLSFGKARLEQSGRLLSDGTRARKKTGNAWYEMQDTCAYHEDFAKDKLVWIELVERGRFAYDNSAIFAEATAFIMTGESLKYLLGFLNSALARWYLSHAAPTSGMGTLRWKKVYVEAVPIPRVAEEKQQSVVQHVDRILLAKSADSDADVSDLESKIDELIFDLYGFTDEEIETMRSSV